MLTFQQKLIFIEQPLITEC